MKQEIVETKDGFHTLFVPELNEWYHSLHGAFHEAMHVYISNGMQRVTFDHIDILEVGFGTGLNAYLTLSNLPKEKSLRYISLEAFPISDPLVQDLNYAQKLEDPQLFNWLHSIDWGCWYSQNKSAEIYKFQTKLQDTNFSQAFDVIYFDAFAPEKQPEMWEESVLNQLYKALKPGGFLVTYCAKGVIKRRFKSCGFQVETLQGPPGKREMILARVSL